MSILFSATPANAVANATFVEVTKEKRTLGLQKVPQVVLLTGRMDSTVTAYSEGDQVIVFDPDQVGQNFGFGSEIHAMARKMTAGQSAFPVPVIASPTQEDIADTASTGTIALTVSNPKAGTLYLYIAGDVYPVSVATTDTATTIGDKIDTAIAADANAIVSSNNVTGTVTFTANWKGTTGDDITIRLNANEEETPEGVTAVITNMSGGAGVRDVDDVLNNITDDQIITVIAHNFQDATNLGKIEAFEATRWAPGIKKGFIAFGGIRGSQSTAVALTGTRNSFVSSIIGIQEVPEMASQVAAAIAAAFARSTGINPSKQLYSTILHGITKPPKADQWTYAERDAALKDGCATIKVIAGRVVIDQLINTFQTTGTGGDAPTVDRQATTVSLLTAIIYDQDNYFTNVWATAFLAEDSPELPANVKIMTPNTMKNELISRYKLYQAEAWVVNLDGYIASLVTEIDSANPERINAQQTIFKIGNLRITAILIDYNFQV